MLIASEFLRTLHAIEAPTENEVMAAIYVEALLQVIENLVHQVHELAGDPATHVAVGRTH